MTVLTSINAVPQKHRASAGECAQVRAASIRAAPSWRQKRTTDVKGGISFDGNDTESVQRDDLQTALARSSTPAGFDPNSAPRTSCTAAMTALMKRRSRSDDSRNRRVQYDAHGHASRLRLQAVDHRYNTPAQHRFCCPHHTEARTTHNWEDAKAANITPTSRQIRPPSHGLVRCMRSRRRYAGNDPLRLHDRLAKLGRRSSCGFLDEFGVVQLRDAVADLSGGRIPANISMLSCS